MDLKCLVHRELGEGMTEEELASAVRVSVRTIANTLSGDLPLDPATGALFGRYFRKDAELLRPGGHAKSLLAEKPLKSRVIVKMCTVIW